MATDVNIVVYVVIALAIVLLALFIARISRRRGLARSEELRRQFGPEYDRVVEQMGNSARAERALIARALRVRHFRFHLLSPGDRRRFESTWLRIQTQFVDDPALAAASADRLISDVMRARGYPTDDFEQRVEDLSVNYPSVVQHYRAAHLLAANTGDRLVNTEDLRQAVVHYRALFTELLQDASRPLGVLRDASA